MTQASPTPSIPNHRCDSHKLNSHAIPGLGGIARAGLWFFLMQVAPDPTRPIRVCTHQTSALPTNHTVRCRSCRQGDVVFRDAAHLWFYYCIQVDATSTSPFVKQATRDFHAIFRRLLQFFAPCGTSATLRTLSPKATMLMRHAAFVPSLARNCALPNPRRLHRVDVTLQH